MAALRPSAQMSVICCICRSHCWPLRYPTGKDYFSDSHRASTPTACCSHSRAFRGRFPNFKKKCGFAPCRLEVHIPRPSNIRAPDLGHLRNSSSVVKMAHGGLIFSGPNSPVFAHFSRSTRPRCPRCRSPKNNSRANSFPHTVGRNQLRKRGSIYPACLGILRRTCRQGLRGLLASELIFEGPLKNQFRNRLEDGMASTWL
jgi:hypothetical protein